MDAIRVFSSPKRLGNKLNRPFDLDAQISLFLVVCIEVDPVEVVVVLVEVVLHVDHQSHDAHDKREKVESVRAAQKTLKRII
jgi:hypothetical protein